MEKKEIKKLFKDFFGENQEKFNNDFDILTFTRQLSSNYRVLDFYFREITSDIECWVEAITVKVLNDNEKFKYVGIIFDYDIQLPAKGMSFDKYYDMLFKYNEKAKEAKKLIK